MSAQIYSETNLPTDFGTLRLRVYRDDDQSEPLAMISGFIDINEPVNVRIHSSCLTSEVFGSCKCDCKHQLDYSLSYISEFTGVVIYLQQEGRGIGLGNKIRAYALQEQGYDTIESNQMLGFPVDSRTYGHAFDILNDLGITRVRLLTNNPAKIQALVDANIQVTTRIPILSPTNLHSKHYLDTKRSKMGHLL
ncbi:MAG: GTP cyclohydrolase II [bacterium]|nr:GTP cyclohydrolase II [Gammaproteobacteria bacterium]HIL96756.1 GTP cyclohydrolase II [Pseudomonadales bacterium]